MLSIFGKRLLHRSIFNSTSLDVSTHRALISHFSSDANDSAPAPKPPTTKQSKISDDPENGGPAQAPAFKEGTPSWVKELLAVRAKTKKDPRKPSSKKKPSITSPDTIDDVSKSGDSQRIPLAAVVEDVLSKSTFKFNLRDKPKRKGKKKPVWEMTQSQLDGEMAKAVEIVSGGNQAVKSELLQKVNPFLEQTQNLESMDELMSASRDSWSEKMDFEQQAVLSKMYEGTAVSVDSLESRLPSLPKEIRDQRPEDWHISVKTFDDFFAKETLGIFNTSDFKRENASSSSILKTWTFLEYEDLQMRCKFAPNSWWDECIRWTDQGKLWHFPINNEQGMDKEAQVSFAEHVFLDEHIEDWCPRDGPIRHFMELVMVGLSKNHFITVEEKIENLNWYRDYFEKHRALLEEINALGSSTDPNPTEGTVSG